ncbi:hypothetical protein Lal_00039849, partial [Lupinus albus]
MSEPRSGRVKTTAKRQRNMDVGGSSSAASGITAARRDLYYSPTLQATRLAKFQDIKLTYIRYADISYLVEQGFEFPHQMELHEVQGKIYPSLVREFYNNFQYKDVVYMSLVGGKRITLYEQVFLDVGGLPNFKYPYGRSETAFWNAFEFVKKWPLEILKVMSVTASSSIKSLCYGIFLSRVFEHIDIETLGLEVIHINPREHLIIVHLIHSLGIYSYGGIWEYRQNIDFEIECDESSEEETDDECNVTWTKFLDMMARET